MQKKRPNIAMPFTNRIMASFMFFSLLFPIQNQDVLLTNNTNQEIIEASILNEITEERHSENTCEENHEEQVVFLNYINKINIPTSEKLYNLCNRIISDNFFEETSPPPEVNA